MEKETVALRSAASGLEKPLLTGYRGSVRVACFSLSLETNNNNNSLHNHKGYNKYSAAVAFTLLKQWTLFTMPAIFALA